MNFEKSPLNRPPYTLRVRLAPKRDEMHSPGITNVKFSGNKVPSHVPLEPSKAVGQRAEAFVFRISCDQNPCTVCDQDLSRGSVTFCRKLGSVGKLGNTKASSSSPSPRKSASTNETIWPSVIVEAVIF